LDEKRFNHNIALGGLVHDNSKSLHRFKRTNTQTIYCMHSGSYNRDGNSAYSFIHSLGLKKLNAWEKEILKQWIDVCATVLAGFMIACILGYIAMHWDTIDVATLDTCIFVSIVLGLFIFFVFPAKEKGEST